MSNKKSNSNINPILIAVFYFLDKIVISIGLIFVVRLLRPSAFGIAELALMFLGIITIGKFTIFHQALIYEKEDKENVYNTGFTSDLILSLVLYLILFISAPIWASFYKTGILTNLIRVGGLAIPIQAFRMVPLAKLEKNLKFNILFKVMLLVSSFRIALTIILALMGFSFWSIIWAYIISEVFSVLLLNLSQPGRIRFDIDIITLKRLIGFGKFIFIINITNFILRNISGLFVGKIIGVMALGYFIVAYKWGFWTLNNIFAPLDRILFPAYAKYRENNLVLKQLFLKSLRYFSIPVFFVAVGLFLIAEEFVAVILGPNWSSVTVPLKVLCLAGLVEFMGLLSYSYLRGGGYIKVESSRQIFYIVLLLLLSYPLIRAHGIIGASLAIAVATTLTQSVYIIYTLRKIKINLVDVFKNIAIPAASAFFMAVAISIAKRFVSCTNIKDIRCFVFLVITEIFIYSAVIILFMGKEIFTILHNITKGTFNMKEVLAEGMPQEL